ncbi:MAG: hypothetical protein EZS28_004009 [Streblomastix strix]|uniref:Uncharacterized protein n=1 Tax=Streblomastix strix TaxID=222440 RepID=A0A5J4X009_9EUKA|nr:MAG: hypothetical protein EZS28_004009 [Streblomastix strix]
MIRTKLSIADINRLLQLYDPNTNMNVNHKQKRSNLSSVLTKIGFYGQCKNVNAVEQAINAVVSRNIYMKQSKAATIIQNLVRKWFNQREQQRLAREQQILKEQEQLQKQREFNIKELREELVPELLDEEGAAILSIKQHIKRKEIYYIDQKVNLCFRTAYTFITIPNSKDKRWKNCSRIAEAKGIFSRVNEVEFRENYQGFDFVADIDNFINNVQFNVHMCTFEDNPPHYELTQNYLVNDSDKQFNILFINGAINAHIMYISDVEALTEFRYCNICHKQAFRIGYTNLQQSIKNHMKKCRKNGGKIVKKVTLENFAKPFVPHILSNKTYKYLFANNLIHLFKLTRYFITYDIETLEKKVNETFGDNSQVTATIIPYAIASSIKLASGIHSFYYDIRTEDYLDKW